MYMNPQVDHQSQSFCVFRCFPFVGPPLLPVIATISDPKCTSCRCSGNGKWHDPEQTHPTGGFLQDQSLGLPSAFPAEGHQVHPTGARFLPRAPRAIWQAGGLDAAAGPAGPAAAAAPPRRRWARGWPRAAWELLACPGAPTNWVWVNIEPPGHRRFQFPCARVPGWVPVLGARHTHC